jgi:hypothetical protein
MNGSKQSLEHKGDGSHVVIAVNAWNIDRNHFIEARCLNKFGVKAVNVVLGHCIKLVSSDGLIRFIIYAFFKNAKKEFNFKGNLRFPFEPSLRGETVGRSYKKKYICVLLINFIQVYTSFIYIFS